MKKKKSNFIVQGGVLAAAGIICRIIGIARRFPMEHIIGDKGNGYYSAAYEVYNIMLLISCYSLPLAVSKVVSAKLSKRQYKSAQRAFNCALAFAVVAGTLMFVICEACGDAISKYYLLEPMSALALKVLGPALLIVAVMGVFRGYFQGLGTMVPTAVSQIVEQIFVLIGTLVGASVLYEYGTKVGALLHNEDYAPSYGAAGASIGPVLGAGIGLVILIVIYVMYKKGNKGAYMREASNNVDSYGAIFRLIILTILPVLLSTTVYNISTIIDLRIYNRIMIAKGLDSVKAYNWGVYSGKYRILVNVPIALANAMCSSIVPVLTGLMVQEDYRQARERISQAMRFTMIVAIPSMVGLAVLARPIISMLFTGEVDMAVVMLHFGAVSVVVYSMSTLTNGVLQGINRMRVPVRNALISLVIHVIFLYIALGVGMGINAVVWGDILFAVVVCVLNNLEISRTIKYKQEVNKTFIIPFIAAAVMGIVIEIVSKVLSLFAGNIVIVFVGLIVGVSVYFVALIMLRGIDENDLRKMPGGKILLGIAKKARLL